MLGGRLQRGGVTLLALGIVTAIALAGPVVGAGKPLTKKRADKRYINVGEKATDSELLDGKDSSAFLQSGPIRLSQGGFDANAFHGNAVIRNLHLWDELDVTAAGGASGVLILTTPEVVGGESYAFQSAELCYQVTAGDELSDTVVFDQAEIATPVVNDTTDRTHSGPGMECYLVSPGTPYVPEGALALVPIFNADAASDQAMFSTVTTTWVPA
jgi:hypothetical protein